MNQRSLPWIYVLAILFVLLVVVIILVMRASKEKAFVSDNERDAIRENSGISKDQINVAPSVIKTLPAGFASVDVLDVRILESFPVQVTAEIRGNLADPCTTAETLNTTYNPGLKTFTLTLPLSRPADQSVACASVLVPYIRSVSLGVENFSAGTYTVIAGDIKKTFTLSTDNIVNSTDGK